MAGTAADARVMLEALEAGTAGALLRTNDPQQARSACSCGRSWHWPQTSLLLGLITKRQAIVCACCAPMTPRISAWAACG